MRTIIRKAKKKGEKDQKREIMELALDSGEIVAVGQYAGLNNLFKIAKKGMEVRITLTGKKKIPNRPQPMLEFDVETR